MQLLMEQKQFHEQVQVLTKNLGSLNAIYEIELQDTNNHLKAMNNFYGNLSAASQTMQNSVEDAKKAHEQIAKLAGKPHQPETPSMVTCSEQCREGQ